jgi:hypothetical protein
MSRLTKSFLSDAVAAELGEHFGRLKPQEHEPPSGDAHELASEPEELVRLALAQRHHGPVTHPGTVDRDDPVARLERYDRVDRAG